MKKPLPYLIIALFFLTILYPAGIIITAVMGYRFELISDWGFCLVIAALSAGIVILDFRYQGAAIPTAIRILLAILPPLSLIAAMFYFFSNPWLGLLGMVFVGCSFHLSFRCGKPFVLSLISLVLSMVMLLPMCYIGFFALLFANFGENTVVQTLESPEGTYCAQVIDSDQGALGGNTAVDIIDQKHRIDLFLVKFEKNAQRIYIGDYGEHESMQIHWQDDSRLIINGEAYEIN